MSDVVIKAEGLGKKYVIGHQAGSGRYVALRDVLVHNVSSMWQKTKDLVRGNAIVQGDSVEEIWALRDINFEIRQGEVVGIIGRNGAGKSTLLKILSRITEPTEGRVSIRGRVSSLLEVGTGFHPELTGRENIFLNGAILGMTRQEIRRKLDEIVAFAEVERFSDTPVKRYSSGMFVRLAFAVAAHLESEILIVDEVLAVGDMYFQRKCLGKMAEVSSRGSTVLFVSHNMAAIQRLCVRGILMDSGNMVMRGPVHEVVQRYATAAETTLGQFETASRSGTGWARVCSLELIGEGQQPVATRPADRDLVFRVNVTLTCARSKGMSLQGLVLELMFYSEEGHPLFSVMNVDDGGVSLPEAENCTIWMCLPGPTFVPGKYRVRVFLGLPYVQHVDDVPDALTFEITPPLHPWRPYDLSPIRGNVCRRANWYCDIPGNITSPIPSLALGRFE